MSQILVINLIFLLLILNQFSNDILSHIYFGTHLKNQFKVDNRIGSLADY